MSALLETKLADLPTLKSSYVFDNAYLVGTGHEKLSDENAVLTLELLEQMGGLEEDSGFSAAKFISQICLLVRVIELWQKTMVKRFGHVASQSAAFERVVKMLLTKQGVQRVLATMPGPLHGKSEADQGIPECFHLVKAMEACKAGGHGPPVCITGEGGDTTLAATPPASQDAPPSQDPGESDKGGMGAEELQALASSLQVAPEAVNDDHLKMLQEVQARYSKIIFSSTKDDFMKTSKEELANNQTAVILIDCPTSRKKVNCEFIDVASQLIRMTSKLPRVLIPVNRRFDLMAGVNEKLMQALPKYVHFCVPVTSKRQEDTLQSLASQEFVFVSVPPEDKRGVPASATTGYAKQIEKLRLRCLDRNCKHRSANARQALPAECADVGEEISPDDRDDPMSDLLAAMVQECDAEGDTANAAHEAAEEGAEAMLQENETEDALEAKTRGYVVDLWPFARPQAHYDVLLRQLGHGGVGQVCFIFTATAHPASAMAALSLNMMPIVFSGRLKKHSMGHGEAIAKHILLTAEVRKHDLATRAAKKRFSTEVNAIRLHSVGVESQTLLSALRQ